MNASPLDTEAREWNYRTQTGAKELTPRQRRRRDKKVGRATARRTHYQAAGWGGVPGECGGECACGVTYYGFDTIGEASVLLDRHIARNVAGKRAVA